MLVSVLCIAVPVFSKSFFESNITRGNDGTFTVSIKYLPVKNISNIKVTGGITGGKELLNRMYKNWVQYNTYPVSFQWKPPKDGTYRVYFEIDPTNANGLLEREVIVIRIAGGNATIVRERVGGAADLSDLVVLETNIDPTEPDEGNSVRIIVKVKNDSRNDTVKPVKIIINHDGRRLCEKSNWANLPAGKTWQTECSVASARVGSHSFNIVLDPEQKINESDEDNNTADGTYYCIPASDIPDIVDER